MSANIPNQSSFLYNSIWTHEMDSALLGSLIRSKIAAGCKGSVFPSQFISEAKLAIENQLGLVFEWYDLVDRLHFLDKRYKSFDEILALEGTYWNPTTNIVIVVAPNWPQALEQNPLLGAYYRHGDLAYNQLNELFGLHGVKEEDETTLIVLSDSQSQGLVRVGQDMKPPPAVDYGEVSSNQPLSSARRKLMFGEGSPLDRESTNKNVVSYYVPDAKGKLERKVEGKASRVIPQPLPPNSPTLAYSSASNSPRMMWRVLGKPNI